MTSLVSQLPGVFVRRFELAEEIAKRVPGDFPKKTPAGPSGSEAVENVMIVPARRHRPLA